MTGIEKSPKDPGGADLGRGQDAETPESVDQVEDHPQDIDAGKLSPLKSDTAGEDKNIMLLLCLDPE